MTRVSKKDRLKKCPRRPKKSGTKTGPKKDNLPEGFRVHNNAVEDASLGVFIPKLS